MSFWSSSLSFAAGKTVMAFNSTDSPSMHKILSKRSSNSDIDHSKLRTFRFVVNRYSRSPLKMRVNGTREVLKAESLVVADKDDDDDDDEEHVSLQRPSALSQLFLCQKLPWSSCRRLCLDLAQEPRRERVECDDGPIHNAVATKECKRESCSSKKQRQRQELAILLLFMFGWLLAAVLQQEGRRCYWFASVVVLLAIGKLPQKNFYILRSRENVNGWRSTSRRTT